MSTILQLSMADNVAVAIKPLVPKQLVSINSDMLEVVDAVPEMHKVALVPIACGDVIRKYGQLMGVASVDIAAGAHVHTHNCVVADVELDYAPCSRAVETQLIPEPARASFLGYKRASGRVGTRNYIGVLTTVHCSATVARHIAAAFAAPDVLSAYANVDGIVALTHETGCGMSDSGEGYELLQRTFEGYLRHPNFGGVLLVGLGCEAMQVKRVLEDSGLGDDETLCAFNIQEQGGTRASVERGIQQIKALLPKVNAQQRTICCASDLTLAVQCGGSDALSGITANPALGVAADWLVKNGGSVIYSETPEIYGAEHLLTQRARTPEVADKLLERIRWWEDYTQRHGVALNNNPSPGNKVGGLTTIMEKSLGAQSKGGSTRLNDVILYAQRATTSGLLFMDSPGYDPVSVTGQVASGANVICFTTGRGSAFGFKPVPSIKLCSNSALYHHMSEDMDVNCGSILDKEASLEELGFSIFQRILAVASGDLTKSELLGYGDVEFNPWKIGAVV